MLLLGREGTANYYKRSPVWASAGAFTLYILFSQGLCWWQRRRFCMYVSLCGWEVTRPLHRRVQFPLVPTHWWGRASGAASGGLLGVFGVCRKYFWVTHTLSFRWHTHSSVYSDLRWISDYIGCCCCRFFFFFPLTEAKKDFLYPCHILVAVMEEEIRRTNSTSYNE